MATFDEKLNKHIDKVIALQNSKRDKMLSLDELKEVDLSLGVTEGEWEQMMKKADKEVILAENHFYYKNYNESYLTAESAVSINPHLTKAIILMADSAFKIYETEDNDTFLEKAEKHLVEVLRRDPTNNRAVETIALINKQKLKEKSEKAKYLKYIITGVGVLLVTLLIMFLKPEKEVKIDNTVKFELIDAEENANAKWAQVENVISRRNKLIPQLFSLITTEDEAINKLKTEINQLQSKIKTSSEEEQVSLQADIQSKFEHITKLISLKNNSENVQTLMIQIEGSYNRIAVEGKRYNEAVKTYNIAVKKRGEDFPNFKLKTYFKGQ